MEESSTETYIMATSPASSPSSSKHAIVPLLPVSYHPNSIISQSYNTPPRSPSSTRKASCWKPTFILVISLPFILVGIIAGSRIHQDLTIGPEAPIVQLTSLSVHEFSVFETNLTAEWDVKLTIQNLNLVSHISFDCVEGFVLIDDTMPLALHAIEPFMLAMKREKQVHMRLATNKWDSAQPALKERVLQKVMKDRDAGEVSFSMQMAIWATYRNGWFWARQLVTMSGKL